MVKKYYLVGLGVICAALYWLLDVSVDILVFGEEGFVEHLFTPSAHELWKHLPFVCALVIFGVFAQVIVNGRRRAEAASRESEERYRKLIETLPGGVTVTDFDGVITYASPQSAALHGFDRGEELVGRKFFEFLAPEARAKAAANFQRAMEEGGVRNLELTFLGKDGSRSWGEVSAALLKDAEGRPTAFIATARDITERRRAEEALRKREEEFRLTFENAKDAIFWADPKTGVVINCNKAAETLLEKGREEIVGHHQTELHPPAKAAYYGEVFKKHLERRGAADEEAEVITKSGKVVPVRITAAVTPVAGKPIIHGIFRDITEQKRAAEELRRAHDELEVRVKERTAELRDSNEELKTFTYLVSHDMRAPLINLKGYAAELREAVEAVRPAAAAGLPRLGEEPRSAAAAALAEDIPEALGYIEASAERMDGFIQAMLKLSRLGRRELNLAPVDMKALVEETLRTIGPQLEARKVTVRRGLLPEVTADRTSLEQILGNLLANAVAYLDPDRPGEIDVSGETNGEEAVFRVRDNGRGIAAADIGKIFEPFARVGEASVSGEGMGLAFVQKLVRRHGGRIWCESEPGVGTTFAFAIPTNHAKGADNA